MPCDSFWVRRRPSVGQKREGRLHPEVEVGRLLLRFGRLLVPAIACAAQFAVGPAIQPAGILPSLLASGAAFARFSATLPAGFALYPMLAPMPAIGFTVDSMARMRLAFTVALPVAVDSVSPSPDRYA